MNEEQLEKIEKEIMRLRSRKIKSDIPDLQVYIDGRIDSLEWVLENIQKMRTLEQIKKEKNFKANIKGYPIDPEGFPKWFLLKRLADEHLEQEEMLEWGYYHLSEFELDDLVMDELADMSNFIDYLATKIVVNYPDRYDPEQVEG